MRRTVVLLAVVSMAVVACGDDDDGGSSSSAAAATATGSAGTESPASSRPPTSTIDPETDQAAAEASLLVLADFPTGWSEVPDSDTDAQREVQTQVSACAGVETGRAFDFGGARAETGTFTSPSNESVDHTVGVAGSISEAEQRMAGVAAPEFATCAQEVYEDYIDDQPLPEGATVGDVTIAPLSVSPLGDETVAYRVTVPVDLGASTVEAYADLVALRSGRALAGLNFGSELVPFPTADAERYLALAAERLAESF